MLGIHVLYPVVGQIRGTWRQSRDWTMEVDAAKQIRQRLRLLVYNYVYTRPSPCRICGYRRYPRALEKRARESVYEVSLPCTLARVTKLSKTKVLVLQPTFSKVPCDARFRPNFNHFRRPCSIISQANPFAPWDYSTYFWKGAHNWLSAPPSRDRCSIH